VLKTPWGVADHKENFGRGIVCMSTPSHGGFYVPPEVRRTWPDALANWVSKYAPAGWFEEDCDWCIPWLLCPEIHSKDTGTSFQDAWDSLKPWHPDLVDPIEEALGVGKYAFDAKEVDDAGKV
jgi:hypothetical protein